MAEDIFFCVLTIVATFLLMVFAVSKAIEREMHDFFHDWVWHIDNKEDNKHDGK